MKAMLWAGPCSPEAQPLKDILNHRVADAKPLALLKNLSGRFDPLLIVSEDPHELALASLRFPQTLQIHVCRSDEFIRSLQQGVRPLQRYFFPIDRQGPDDFRSLIKELEPKLNPVRRPLPSLGPLPSLHNSLEVLRRLTDDRLFELRNFSFQDEDRRKNFRSLINLARSLSMSRDIEEVVQYLWQDLKSIDGLKMIRFLVPDAGGGCHQVVSKNGKFHFEETPPLTQSQMIFLQEIFDSHQHPEVIPLQEKAVEALNILLKDNLTYPSLCFINSTSLDRNFILILESHGSWEQTQRLSDYLRERLSFIHLTLEKHLLQEAIKAKTKLWATTFDELRDPLAILTQGRTIVRANRQFQELGGNLCYHVWAKSEKQCSQCPPLIHSANSFELQIRQKIYQARLFPILDDENKPSDAFVAHYVDVTTERILYSRLIQSEKMIAVGKLAGDLSQALSIPLKNIILQSERILNLSHLAGPTRSDIENILKAALRSLRIIEDFENFSRGHIEKNLVMAETIIEKTIPLVKALLHGHRFYLQLAEPKNLIMASFSLLQQVLYNLLRNAHQAMTSPGEIRITTEARSWNEKAGVQICVLDSGPGVSPEMREKIFQPLVTDKAGSEGTGLGLNIVKQIIESHGGQVGYEPRPEGGSRFWFWLPTE